MRSALVLASVAALACSVALLPPVVDVWLKVLQHGVAWASYVLEAR